ncbi:MAG: hypothetical protein WC880_02670 [Candidatus Paceibacterota bacterium]
MKIKQIIPFFLVLLGISLEYVAYWCVYSVGVCYGSLVHQSFDFIKPLYIFSLAILPITLVLCFVSSLIFKSWLKFAMWWVPLSILVIVVTPVTNNSWMPLYSFVKEDVAWFMGGVFVVISLGIIVWKTLSLRKKN